MTWLKVVVPLAVLFLVEGALAADWRNNVGADYRSVVAPPKITEAQKQVMRRGIAAGRKFADILQKGQFDDAIKKMDDFVKPWTEGMEMHMYFFWLFFRTVADDILDEVKKGFGEVNGRLDTIISELGEIKKIIIWKDMEVRFGEIEANVRLLDSTLQGTLRSPNREDGINKFKTIFETSYNSAGFYLYDAVANNDQVFSKNLLAAAVKYSDQHRRKCHAFFKGLIGLLIKAMNVEIANEKFNNQNIGQKVVWRERLAKSRAAMTAVDKVVAETAWKKQPAEEAKVVAGRMTKNTHEQFAIELHKVLSAKYYWRYWLVVSYDGVSGLDKHFQKFSEEAHAHWSWRKFERNYILVSTDPKAVFHREVARHYLRPVTCRALPHLCHRNTARWMINLTADYGVGRMVVRTGTKLAFRANPGRWEAARVRLNRPTPGWYATYNMIYFG